MKLPQYTYTLTGLLGLTAITAITILMPEGNPTAPGAAQAKTPQTLNAATDATPASTPALSLEEPTGNPAAEAKTPAPAANPILAMGPPAQNPLTQRVNTAQLAAQKQAKEAAQKTAREAQAARAAKEAAEKAAKEAARKAAEEVARQARIFKRNADQKQAQLTTLQKQLWPAGPASKKRLHHVAATLRQHNVIWVDAFRLQSKQADSLPHATVTPFGFSVQGQQHDVLAALQSLDNDPSMWSVTQITGRCRGQQTTTHLRGMVFQKNKTAPQPFARPSQPSPTQAVDFLNKLDQATGTLRTTFQSYENNPNAMGLTADFLSTFPGTMQFTHWGLKSTPQAPPFAFQLEAKGVLPNIKAIKQLLKTLNTHPHFTNAHIATQNPVPAGQAFHITCDTTP
ncbi:MAG: hypothetical protein V3V20_09970 [Algisphaera sp.]